MDKPYKDFEEQEHEDMEELEYVAPQSSFAKEIYALLKDFAMILTVVTLLFVFVVRLVGVSGQSMVPTLYHGDYMILLSDFLYDDYQYGDVIVTTSPTFSAGERSIVKRVIACGGDEVYLDFANSTVYVNGEALQEAYIAEEDWYRDQNGWLNREYQNRFTVPEGHYFVMGDNRNHSSDSRYEPIGFINREYILGKVLVIGFPGETTDIFGDHSTGRDFGRIGAVK